MSVRCGLTVLQPYASAIAVGPKRIENRGWGLSPVNIGPWIALHAGRSCVASQREMINSGWAECPPVEELPTGSILGIFRVDYVRPDSCAADEYPHQLPWIFGPKCWHIAEVRTLKSPIPCRGMPGLWRLPSDIGRALQALADAPSSGGVHAA